MTKDTKRPPCPFCGHRAVTVSTGTMVTGKEIFYAECCRCAACGPTADGAEKARALWDARAMFAAGPHSLTVCAAFVHIFEETDMRPESECSDLYRLAKLAIANAEGA